MPCGAIARSVPSAWSAISLSSWTTTAPTSGPTAICFAWKEDLEPEVVSGVPPDAFSATGQRWGNPLYNWDAIRARGYDWWVAAPALGHSDLRLHPPRSLPRLRAVLGDSCQRTHRDARPLGGWPQGRLVQQASRELGGLPFFAEDLGYITPDVHALRERHQIPGMAVLQFGFGDPGAHIYLPHRLTPDRVIYTGTHDNDTTVGWWKSGVSESERRAVQAYVGPCEDGIHWALIRLAQESVASLSVVPLQDVLGLGSEARLNTPSVSEGNFRWRYQPGSLTRALAEKLAALAEVTDRVPPPMPVPPDEDFAA